MTVVNHSMVGSALKNISFKLQNGNTIPALGLGTWKAQPNEVGNAVLKALELGYRHLDCAAIYGNEEEIGDALEKAFEDKLVKREELFITTKLWNTEHDPKRVPIALDTSLKKLKLSYIDLYLIHWPLAFGEGKEPWPKDSDGNIIINKKVTVLDTWKAMEALVDAGKAKNIGVSNFGPELLKTLVAESRIKPQVNQVELHPYLKQSELIKFCQTHGIILTAYSAFGSARDPNLLGDPVIENIAKKEGFTTAQVILAWVIQGCKASVIPKSTNPLRLEQNFEAKSISDESIQLINEQIATKHRYIDPRNFWGIDVFGEGKKSGELSAKV